MAAAREEQHAHLASVMDSIDDLVFGIDTERRFTHYHAPNGRELYAPPSEFLGRPYAVVLPPDVVTLLDAALDTVTRSGAPSNFDCRLQLGARETWWNVKVSQRRNADGSVAGFTVLSRDITERVESAARLRASEEQYRSLVDNLDAVVFSTNLEGQITFIKRAVERFGYTPASLLGRSRDELTHPDDIPRLRAMGHDPSQPRRVAEYRIFDAAGRVRTVRSATRPLVQRGVVVGATGVLEDLTAQRETEAQLRDAQKMEAIGRLAGGIAHDFKNLLTVILSYTQFAMADLEPGAPIREDLEEVERAATRAADLTRQLMAFGRRQVLRPEALSFCALVADLSKTLERLLGEGITLTVKPPVERCEVFADRAQLEQVVMNLVLNARDAMPEGGRVEIEGATVTLDEDHAARLDVAAGKYVEMAVRDTGHGMDAATLAQIFEPFFTTKPLGKGSGLGLAMVYGLVRQSGGAVRVESEVGRGTTFRVLLPRARESERAPPI